MGRVSVYASDDETVNSLKSFFSQEEQSAINFYQALHTARSTSDGVVVDVGSRKFLLHPVLGVVMKELF